MNTGGIVGTIIACILAYLIGSINLSLIIGLKLQKKDIRNYYSKNAGATNATRVLGFKIGFASACFDMLKLPVSMVVTWLISFITFQTASSTFSLSETSYYISAFFCILGHCFPIYFGFKGGKGIACFSGLTWMISPWIFLIFLILWWGIALTYRVISVASLVAIFFTITLTWIPQLHGLSSLNFKGLNLLTSTTVWFNHAHTLNTTSYADNLIVMNIVITMSGILIIVKHHRNIHRILHKQEKKISFIKK